MSEEKNYEINVIQNDNIITVTIDSKHSLGRQFDIVTDKDGLHITGSDPLSLTWNKSNSISIDTVT